jgi:hypothetical protein
MSSAGGAVVAYWVANFAGQVAAGRLDRAGRLPDWARGTEPPAGGVDYSVPPPKDGPIFNGRADQAPFKTWLRRRQAGPSH